MSLVEKVKAICQEQMQELARTIEGELKVECPSVTGKAVASIHIEQEDDYHIFVGAHASFSSQGGNGGAHLYYADQGNDGSGRIIRSTRKYDRRGIPPGKLSLPWGYYSNVTAYDGKHFIAKVANRHR